MTESEKDEKTATAGSCPKCGVNYEKLLQEIFHLNVMIATLEEELEEVLGFE